VREVAAGWQGGVVSRGVAGFLRVLSTVRFVCTILAYVLDGERVIPQAPLQQVCGC
jgi:hypothetical protein